MDVRSTPAGPHVWPWRDNANGKYAGVFVPSQNHSFNSVSDCVQKNSNPPGTKIPDTASPPSQVSTIPHDGKYTAIRRN